MFVENGSEAWAAEQSMTKFIAIKIVNLVTPGVDLLNIKV
jgi:hypothetical protein